MVADENPDDILFINGKLKPLSTFVDDNPFSIDDIIYTSFFLQPSLMGMLYQLMTVLT